jgi:glycosyltransferase involved in cell wall biosynthesis
MSIGPYKKLMNILALVPAANSGNTYLTEELKAFSERGVAVHVVSFAVKTRCVVDGVTIHPVPRKRQLFRTLASLRWFSHVPQKMKTIRDRIHLCRALRTISRVIQQEQIDVIYSPFCSPYETAGLPAATLAGIPVVPSLRGADVLVEESIGYGNTLDPNSRKRISATLSRADHVIGVSRAIADRGIELGASAHTTSVVLKGVDEVRFSPADTAQARRKLELDDVPTVLFVGLLIPRKGVACLLGAFEIVRQRIPNAQLVLCGEGPELATLKDIARERNIDSAASFVGRVERDLMPEYFRACDVFVLPSLTEGSGNVLVEAGACAKPLVGTNTAGIPDYIDEGVTGYLFQKNDPDDLADKLVAILQDKPLASRMGEAARKRVEKQHTYDQMIDQLLGIFRAAVQEKNS